MIRRKLLPYLFGNGMMLCRVHMSKKLTWIFENVKSISPRHTTKCPMLHRTFAQVSLYSAIALGVVQCEHPKPQFKLPENGEMSPKQVLQQSSAVTAAATMQLLQLTTAAVINASSTYRENLAAEMLLLKRSLEFVNVSFMMDDFNDMLIAVRADIQQSLSELQELLGFMGYVEKLANSAAETSFLAGAEYSSFSLSDILFHAQKQVSEQQAQNQGLEVELRILQQQLVLRSAKPEPTPTPEEEDQEEEDPAPRSDL